MANVTYSIEMSETTKSINVPEMTEDAKKVFRETKTADMAEATDQVEAVETTERANETTEVVIHASYKKQKRFAVSAFQD